MARRHLALLRFLLLSVAGTRAAADASVAAVASRGGFPVHVSCLKEGVRVAGKRFASALIPREKLSAADKEKTCCQQDLEDRQQSRNLGFER